MKKEKLGQHLSTFVRQALHSAKYFLLVYIFFVIVVVRFLSNRVGFLKPILKPLLKLLNTLAQKLDRRQKGNPSQIDIISLAMENMAAKKTRTIITVGGMTIGIGIIVFLISIGFGLQAMVIDRVARLEELKQVEISTSPGSKIKLNDETIATFAGINGVKQVLPVINVVGKINYKGSATDMAVYGVTKDYLEQSAIKPTIGRIFENNSVAIPAGSNSVTQIPQEKAIVAEIGEKFADINFTINQGTWLTVRKDASRNSEIIGYIDNQIGQQKAEEIWGETYIDNQGNGSLGVRGDGTKLGLWLKVSVPLWELEGENYVPLTDTEGNQVYSTGFIPKIDVDVLEIDNRVLGDTIDVTNSDWVELNESVPETENLKVVSMASSEHEAVVNQSFLDVLQIPEAEAVGQTFEVTMVSTGLLLESNQDRIQSEPVEYTIIGITPDNKTPQFYVPFTDVRSLGINNFSQLKVVVKNENDLPEVRKKIESLGYNTYSVVDTVNQIESLFGSVRILLALLGSVALAISTLGMFNTLTVSLIERTREVGLLKAMGMKSYEIKDLFFAESILMGSLGGILGIFFGFVFGKILEMLLSIFSIMKGVGPLVLVDMPISFTLSIILLSFLVGFLTGIYPARRATKISALNALRYE